MQQIVHAEEHLDTTPSRCPWVRFFLLDYLFLHFTLSRPSEEPVKAEAEEESKDVEKLKPKPEIVKKLADDWDEEDEEEQEKKRAEEEAKQPGRESIKLFSNLYSQKNIC